MIRKVATFCFFLLWVTLIATPIINFLAPYSAEYGASNIAIFQTIIYSIGGWPFIIALFSRKSPDQDTPKEKRSITARFSKDKANQTLSAVSPMYYERALAEIENDKKDRQIWAKAYAKSLNEEETRRLYVDLRATQLAISELSRKPENKSVFDSIMSALWTLTLFVFWGSIIVVFLFGYFRGNP